ncbi:2-hydroxymuconate semialdehyde dehydrogenase [Trinickia symbiotica]|uniref:2-hydroxymuconic semialdehyde dehydrogenase n=1 Tax=Trinickia symbiotica TaxID=863227 RepID=A0A2N7X9Z8_9BURK|nr:2-hydroxymuconic semialdehyde dehydrogenase [Trinickia symbiotica]PMS38589.1 2-hydroxymuconic semialdehyde dehydrogenase [Trinickia symbiotica]PPK46585.1 2-hydroxymuconate semialdehyde dehydrogenase [Trinickia symbiotica]
MILNFVNGGYREGTAGKRFPNIDPCTGRLLMQVSEAGKEDVDDAVRAARGALSGAWGNLTLVQRCDLLYAVAAEIDCRKDDFIAAEVADTGKPRALAAHLDIPRGAANFRAFADAVRNVPTECFTGTAPDGKPALNYALRRPKGVIAVVCPWNLPLLLMTWKVAPALACGNAVVVKPSEETPATATLLGEVMNAVGVPAGVYNVVHGFGPDSAGEFLVGHPDVDAITFTGETRTGAAILKTSAEGIKPVSMELGGKNPALVFADADIHAAIAGLKRSVFENSGQVCLGTERVYVERPMFDKVVDALAVAARTLKPGGPEDPEANFGPLISREHQSKVLSYYALAHEEGAIVHCGGGVPDMPAHLRDGAWIQPTIWTGLSRDSRVLTEEIFGPCCHIEPFDTEEEAIRLANATPYGLAASIYTSDVNRAHRVSAKLAVGIVWVNTWFLRDLRTAFGGSGKSGIGREGGVHSLEFYTELSNVCLKLEPQA